MEMTRVLVTGSLGKVGRAAVRSLRDAGYDVTGTDVARPVYDAGDADSVPYLQADLTIAGDAFAVVRGMDVVVHAAGIPEPSKNTPQTVFLTNVTSTFNVIEASARLGVKRVVNLSSDSVAGMTWAERPFVPLGCPIDESHPELPQDAYGISKQVSELLCDGLVRRTDATCVSIRPTWVLTEATYEQNLAPFFADPDLTTAVFWSYIDVRDLANLIVAVVASETPGHEVVYAAAADNFGGRDLAAEVARLYPGLAVGPLDRVDASGISSRKAQLLFGWHPEHSWRDHLDASGRALVRGGAD
jgi:nucleoside-diphosphate-sugar epimerase